MICDKERVLDVIAFTQLYKSEPDKYLREAKCLDFQLDNILVPLEENDVLAGMMQHGFVGFSSQYGGLYTYYYNERDFQNALEKVWNELTPDEQKLAQAAGDFWHYHNTKKKVNERFIQKFGFEQGSNYLSPGPANCSCRIAGTNVDFGKLIRLGLPGLLDEINVYRVQSGGSTFYDALEIWIETLKKVCNRYAVQALDWAQKTDGDRKEGFLQLAAALRNLCVGPPQSFLEGLQLMWIYSVCSDLMNYARMDDYLGDLYASDLANGVIDEETGIRYILGLYQRFKQVGKIHDCRVIIGGKGRAHEENADKLAMAIMEASRRFRDTVPQLTMRYYHGMSEEVFDKAMQVNMEGCTFPIIYSDETNIPAVMEVYGVSEKEAEQYVPFGCGEYVLVGMSTGTPNNGVNLLKALECALHNGVDHFNHVDMGIHTGTPQELDSYDKLYAALLKQLDEPIYRLAYHKMLNYRTAGDEAGYLHLSLLMDDCIARGKALFEGGVRYENASSEIFGLISCADSLTAIRKYVYEEKRFTLPQLVEMLDKNYEGFEAERQLLLSAPKYGNDDAYADETAVKLFADIADMTSKHGQEVGLHRYNIVSVNNSMSADWGFFCDASACGRKRSSAMANANGASIGADKNGITALLNSMSKFDNQKHVGVINNIRLTKEMFQSSYDKIKFLLKTFYENGGVQTNLSVVGRDDLINAQKHPEKYQNLLVRIGGFSARFVTLDPILQKEIIERTTYAD